MKKGPWCVYSVKYRKRSNFVIDREITGSAKTKSGAYLKMLWFNVALGYSTGQYWRCDERRVVSEEEW